MFAKHLPPSRGEPRVLALDDWAAADLPEDAECDSPRARRRSPTGFSTPWPATLRPKRRPPSRGCCAPAAALILAHPAEPERLRSTLTAAGLAHCLVESREGVSLYRGERPANVVLPARDLLDLAK